MTESKVRSGINWEEKLFASDIGLRKEDGKEMKVVYLRGLQRLAQEAGLRRSYCKFNFITKADTGTVGIMQAIYELEFEDGSIWTGSADCNQNNTNSKFMAFPTAVAESRAEARALRKALGIGIISSEEVGFADGGAIESIQASSGKRIDSQVVKAIEKLCESRSIPTAQLLEEVLTNDRNSAVFELSELTVDEGQKAMSWLNDQKVSAPAKTKLTAAETRDARKKELQK